MFLVRSSTNYLSNFAQQFTKKSHGVIGNLSVRILVHILNSQIPYIVPSTIDYKLRQHDERIVMIFGNIYT